MWKRVTEHFRKVLSKEKKSQLNIVINVKQNLSQNRSAYMALKIN